MKNILRSIILTLVIGGGLAAFSQIGSAASNSPLPLSYRAKYCYPTGTYWQSQLSNPNNAAYYLSHNAQYTNLYGATTRYCPAS